MRRPPTPAQEQKRCDKFNELNPVGTRVNYWRGLMEGTPSGTGETTHPAQLLSGHTAVVWIKGCSGCIGLTHVTAARAEAAHA